jgi:hypothetical protein
MGHLSVFCVGSFIGPLKVNLLKEGFPDTSQDQGRMYRATQLLLRSLVGEAYENKLP